jgi:hypothetical protein
MQSVHINTNVVSSSLSVTCDRLVVFYWSSTKQVSSTNKTDRHDITEILLKAALSIITLLPILMEAGCSLLAFYYFTHRQCKSRKREDN